MKKVFTALQLKGIYSVMQNMHSEAVKGNWPELDRLDSQRRELLEAGTPSAQHEAAKNTPEYVELRTKILQLDTAINDKVSNARQLLINENRDFTAQLNAKKGYQNVAAIQSRSYG